MFKQHFTHVLHTTPPYKPRNYILTLKKARTASTNPKYTRHTVKCMLFRGLWQCISNDEIYIEPRRMHHKVWEPLAEAMEFSTREVAESVSGRFESQKVREKVAEQTINKMVSLFIPSSKVTHSRQILFNYGKDATCVLQEAYNVVTKGSPLLAWSNGAILRSTYDAFSFTNLTTNSWEETIKCTSRGFVVHLTAEFDLGIPSPFNKARLLAIFERFLQKKYSNLFA